MIIHDRCQAFEVRIKILQDALTKAHKVLDFYADEGNYSPLYERQGVTGRHGKQLMFIDGGSKAREFISSYPLPQYKQ
jgi:hypothetical protein